MGTPEQTRHEQHRFTRSALLKGGGALVVLIGVPAAAWRITSRGSDAPTTWPTELDPASLDSWLAIHADGTVTAFTGKTEATVQALISQVQAKASVAQAARTLDPLR